MPQVKLIMGVKGSGKTKQFIDLVTHALEGEKGDIVCLEKGSRLTYDLPHAVRLIESAEYGFNNYEFLKGFLSGLRAGNYDITHVFIDSVLRMIDVPLDERAEEFFDWCEAFGQKHGIKFTMMVSADVAAATENIRKYF
ncbi:MAG: hypothetical protein LBC78_01660 [Oscillospiraceae bacterium]|jgi:hypothetical protein|nr:hypothetical protein [Oscillospiraceae bacterium]